MSAIRLRIEQPTGVVPGRGTRCGATARDDNVKREAILHIGPMKTGSTSIQGWMRRNRDTLSTLGLHVPRRTEVANLSKLSKLVTARANGSTPDSIATERWTRLSEELAESPESARRVLISGEMLGQRLRESSEVAALKAMLDPYFDRYTIILYLRRQDEISVSLYNTQISHRAVPIEDLLSDPIDYAALLDTWSGVFGREAIMPRLFARADLVGGDIITDFAAALGLPAGSIDTSAKVKNQSMTPAAQSFFARLYGSMDQGSNRSKFDPDTFALMVRAIARQHTGPGRLPSRDAAIAFTRTMDVSNERVRQEWFPDRERLFSDDYSRYPEDPTPEASTEEVLKVAISVVERLLVGTADRGSDPDDLDDAAAARPRGEGGRGKGGRRGGQRKANDRRARRAAQIGA
jgi:hypothetical protein